MEKLEKNVQMNIHGYLQKDFQMQFNFKIKIKISLATYLMIFLLEINLDIFK